MPKKKTNNDQLWESRFDDLKEYHRKHGHCNVPRGNKSLGNWAHNQRTMYSKGRLTPERFEKMQKLGFRFEREEDWDERYHELREYFKSTGSFHVPDRVNRPLACWTRYQRKVYRQGVIKDDRMKKLNKIGFTWENLPSPPACTEQWEERYQELAGYVKHHHSFRIRIGGKNPELRNWIYTQRKDYRDGRMKQERIDKLNAIDFPWESDGGARKRKTPDEDGSKPSSDKTQVFPVGTRVCKEFESGFYYGSVTEFNPNSGWYCVVYEDDDVADYTENELRKIAISEEQFVNR